MARWIQETKVTYTDGTVKNYDKTVRTEADMIDMIAQVMFLKQAGEDIELDAEEDLNFDRITYIVHRNLKNKKKVQNIFRKED